MVCGMPPQKVEERVEISLDASSGLLATRRRFDAGPVLIGAQLVS